MSPIRLLPDVEALTVNRLRASADVTALVGQRVGTTLYDGLTPALKVTLVSGDERVRDHLDAPRVQVDAYGGTKADANDLARTARAALVAVSGAFAEGVVTAVRTLVTPWWNPDSGFEPPRPRYSFDVELTVHP